MRNPNGYGSVYKLPGNRRRPWIATVTKRYIKGKRIPLIIGYFATRPEAIKALADYNESPSDKLSVTFKTLYEEWKSIKDDCITKSTRQGYEAAFEHLADLHSMRFKDIRTAHIRKAMKEARVIERKKKPDETQPETETTKEAKPLSQSSLSKIKALCTQLYNYAMEHDIVRTNYASLLNLSEIPRAEQTREIDAFTDIEIATIEKGAASGIPNSDIILIMCYTGFRINEFLPLTKLDYRDKYLIGGSKTDAGKNRIVPVHSKIKPYLDKRLGQAGETIICDEKGRAYKENYFREKIYYPALESLGVRKLSPHCCRHTCASIMDKNSVDKKTQQLILGHTKYEQTAHYTHRDIDNLVNEMSKIS